MNYRYVLCETIESELSQAITDITFNPDQELATLLKKALLGETNEIARDILNCMLKNIELAPKIEIPLCQDTGTLVVFAEIGNKCIIEGPPLPQIINNTLTKVSSELFLRSSILKDPLLQRENSETNSPAIIHIDIVDGDKLKLQIAQKGGGAENMSRLKMFTPSAEPKEIINFAIETVQLAGGKACPPLIIGIGIGGNFENCALLAKKALFQPLTSKNPLAEYATLEQDILAGVNNTGIGVQGLGGNNTALTVHILTAPCHIASLPVAVNVQCHSHRHKEIII
ncbi:MAG: fumarate hydratase [Candidatus Cloacimonas sp.]